MKKITKNLSVIILCLTLAAGAAACAGKKPAENAGQTPSAPRIPHTTEGRENCLGCHEKGLSGAPVTPHPQRPNCTNCHKPK